MTKTRVKNGAASVRQRLLHKSRSDARPFQELVQYYAMERFLYRLTKSQHANQFILKGALLLQIWQKPEIRSTMDIDLLGRASNTESDLISNVINIISVDVDHVVMQVKKFIGPIASALTSRKSPPSKWHAPGPWV